MSDVHTASYAPVVLKRQEIFDLLSLVLKDQGVSFLHSVRGFDLDDSAKEFVPDADRELENIGSFQDAYLVAAGWECACYDFRLLQWSFELFWFETDSRAGVFQNIALAFPHSLYRIATKEATVTTRWLSLLTQLGVALGKVTMICGPEVLLVPSTEPRLLARFQHYVNNFQPGTYSIHTVLCSSAALDEQTRQQAAAAGFSERPVDDGYLLLTQLPLERE
jgi:hypothetical protein